jgi:hypothetical protein
MIKARDEYCFECEQYHPRWLSGCQNKPIIILEKKHGGKRQNAGRKSQYKEETQTISFRVPKSLIEPITKYVKRALAKSKK